MESSSVFLGESKIYRGRPHIYTFIVIYIFVCIYCYMTVYVRNPYIFYYQEYESLYVMSILFGIVFTFLISCCLTISRNSLTER